MNRPKNIKEVSRLLLDNLAKELVIGDFLDEFKLASDKAAALCDEPLHINPKTDARLAAIAEMLAVDSGLQPPAWTEHSDRFLQEWDVPAWIKKPEFIELLKSESPQPFAKRKIAVSSNAFTRV